jgi:hypothetical protein
MKPGTAIKHAVMIFALLMPILGSTAARAAGGELWETRSTMESSQYGSMPLGVNRECRPADWRKTPEFKAPGNDSECKSQKVTRTGDGYAWKFDCEGTRGEGSARMIRNDQMQGQMRMETPEGNFHLQFTSRKIGMCNSPGRG